MKRLQKETPTQVFSGEICEIIDYTFFYRTLRWLLRYMIEVYLGPYQTPMMKPFREIVYS